MTDLSNPRGARFVSVSYFASAISTSTDEHAAPILGVFTIFASILIAAADIATQGLLAAARMSRRAFGHR